MGVLILLLSSLGFGCQESEIDSAAPVAGPPSVDRGRKIYSSLCIACHDADPNKNRGGSPAFGPDIADSPYELLRLRVLKTEYPEGYTPKRTTRFMTSFPLKEPDLRDLHAFLQDALVAKAPASP